MKDLNLETRGQKWSIIPTFNGVHGISFPDLDFTHLRKVFVDSYNLSGFPLLGIPLFLHLLFLYNNNQDSWFHTYSLYIPHEELLSFNHGLLIF